LTASPVNVPETFFVVGAVVVLVAAGVGLAVALCVAAGVGSALFVAVAFALLLAAELLAGAALSVAAGAAAGDWVAVEAFATGAIPAPRDAVLSEEVSCGGVIAKTAPSPPTVPPAINSARFMPLLSLSYL
jgi:hypothetical protein